MLQAKSYVDVTLGRCDLRIVHFFEIVGLAKESSMSRIAG